jgi:hypothetical protein
MMSWLRWIANCHRMRNEKECVEVGRVIGMLAKRTRGCGEALEMIFCALFNDTILESAGEASYRGSCKQHTERTEVGSPVPQSTNSRR